MGRHFLHEHPVHASSWCMPEMRELLNDGRVHLVQRPMCHWRLASTGDGDEQGFCAWKDEMGDEQLKAGNIRWQENMREKIVEYG